MCLKKLFGKLTPAKEYLFTSESVSVGHPDKLCDYIADTIKDYVLSNDPSAHVAVEVSVTTNYVLVFGEISSSIKKIPIVRLVKEAVNRVGYVHDNEGFSVNDLYVKNLIHSQSSDINMGTNDEVGGAGDQGIIFGYACDETPEYIPLSWKIARDLTDQAWALSIENPNYRPDSKSQVTVKYKNGNIVGIDTIVLSVSHVDIPIERVRAELKKKVLIPVLSEYGYQLSSISHIYINPTGRFVIHGPNGDSGLTGRKLVVDCYGGHSAVGGGTLQGKDPSKVDNSAALMSRFIAKNIVAAGLAKKCTVQLSYAIGIQEPVSVRVDCDNTALVSEHALENFVIRNVDCTPMGIINQFDLRKQHGADWEYSDCSAHGWFGRSQFPWEKLDLVPKLFGFLPERHSSMSKFC